MSQWKWCLTDNNGKVIKGWYKDKGKWYHLDENSGIMNTGWFQDKDKRWYYLDETNGNMKTGWLQLKNIWYYLEPSSTGYMGSMYCNGNYTIGGKSYSFNSSGAWIEDSLVSQQCIDFIKSWEGFSATPYKDEVGVWTLGYGMTGEEIQGISEVTEIQATSMLKDWINNKYAPIIKADLDSKGMTLKQNEFDALVSFAYNCGTAGLLGSTLYKNIIAGVRDSATILSNFQAWSNGGGMRIEGLYRRRTKEDAMFFNADYTGNN
ncbi:cell wall-binding protein [Clostridium beijerinckii]|nr:cell wall-binding protein [Clostridium beijerinckii]